MIGFTDSLQVAYTLLQAINVETANEVDILKYAYVESFANCREQGFSIVNQDRKISFSRFRSCDSIVVYSGKYEDFNYQSNVPKDSAERNFFDEGKYTAAAEFIVDFLKGAKG